MEMEENFKFCNRKSAMEMNLFKIQELVQKSFKNARNFA